MKSQRVPSEPCTGFEDPLQWAWVLVGLLGIVGGLFGVGFSIVGGILLPRDVGLGASVLLFGAWCTLCSLGVVFGRAWALIGWVIALLVVDALYVLSDQPLIALLGAVSTLSLLQPRLFRGLVELRARRHAAQPSRA